MDNTEDNVFVKIPESTLSVSTILSEVGKKTSLSPDELVLLDSKLILIADDKGQFGLKIIIYNYNKPFYHRNTVEHTKTMKKLPKHVTSL